MDYDTIESGNTYALGPNITFEDICRIYFVIQDSFPSNNMISLSKLISQYNFAMEHDSHVEIFFSGNGKSTSKIMDELILTKEKPVIYYLFRRDDKRQSIEFNYYQLIEKMQSNNQNDAIEKTAEEYLDIKK